MTLTLGGRKGTVVVPVVLLLMLLLILSSSQWRRSRTSRATVEVAAVDPLVLGGRSDGKLTPGTTRSINLAMSNQYNRTVVLTEPIVTVTSVGAPDATPSLPSTLTDFSISPSRLEALILAPRATTTLRTAGIDRWLSVTMINTHQDQDGGPRASLSLSRQAIGDFG